MYMKSTIVTEFMLSIETIRTNNLQLHEQCFGDYQTFICMSAFFNWLVISGPVLGQIRRHVYLEFSLRVCQGLFG